MKQELADYLNKETDKLKAEQRAEKMKKITYVIEVTVELNEGVNPEEVCFVPSLDYLTPVVLGKGPGQALAGKALSYTTTDFYEN